VWPEEDEAGTPPAVGANGEEVRVMRFGGPDGDTKTTTWLKNDMVKTFSESEMGRSSIIRDNAKKITTTVMEMMGRKFGFYATDEEMEASRKRMDSMMQQRRSSNPDNQSANLTSPTAPKVDIIYIDDETKKIAGFECRKAFIVTTRSNGKSDSSVVWYAPEFLLQGVSSTGGALGGFGGFGGGGVQSAASAMEQLKGFPMQYERNMGRGRKMTVVVTKIVTDKEIADKEFEIPKDVEIKPMKDMQNSGGGQGFRMTIRD